MKKYDKYIKKARQLGAKNARIIPSENVVVAPWVLIKCQFGCNGYGKRLTCPPNSPTPGEMKQILTNYTHALLIHGDNETPVSRIVPKLEKMIFLDGYEKAFGMGAGPCYLCDVCPDTCKYPEVARPSMEACGIDVFSTVRKQGFPIEVVKTEQDTPNFYGLILIV